MEYVRKKRKKGSRKVSWAVIPPADVEEAGLARKQYFTHGARANSAAAKLKKTVEDYRSGKIPPKKLNPKSNYYQLVAHYLATEHFRSLARKTQLKYEPSMRDICETPVGYGNKVFGEVKIGDVTAVMCSHMYDYWVKTKTVNTANDRKRIFAVMMSHAISLDLATHNPMARIKSAKHTPKVEVWTPEEVKLFVDTAMQDFRHRNLGLLVLMCYEWGQRPIDIAHLKWENIDWDEGTVVITQKKRGATVYLPLSEEMREILLKQKKDFDFQPHVVPYLRKHDAAWRPMDTPIVSIYSKEVKEKAGLSQNLHLRGLRKTAIMELVENGADALQIMPLTGHKNPSSLTPYLKHTRKGAQQAMKLRKQK